MYYLYRHIRPDKDIPFYIGVGTEKEHYTKKSRYYRAYRLSGRNDIWNYIVKKNNGKYDIQIVFKSKNRKVIEDKEKEFIDLYGRIDLKNGCLSNLTEGGEKGFIRPGKPKVVYKYGRDGNFIKKYNSLTETTTEGFRTSSVSSVANGRLRTTKGCQFRFFKKDKIDAVVLGLSEETKQKISEKALGRKVSKETRKKISIASKNKIPYVRTEEYRKNKSEEVLKKGHLWTKSAVEKRRNSMVGKKQKKKTIDNRAFKLMKPVIVYNDTETYCFLSVRYALEDLNLRSKIGKINCSSPHRAAKGYIKTAYGYRWKYAETNSKPKPYSAEDEFKIKNNGV